jgi:hypothetical protein
MPRSSQRSQPELNASHCLARSYILPKVNLCLNRSSGCRAWAGASRGRSPGAMLLAFGYRIRFSAWGSPGGNRHEKSPVRCCRRSASAHEGAWAGAALRSRPRDEGGAVKSCSSTGVQLLRGGVRLHLGVFGLGTVPGQERIEIGGSLTTGRGAGLQVFGQPQPGIDPPHFQGGQK